MPLAVLVAPWLVVPVMGETERFWDSGVLVFQAPVCPLQLSLDRFWSAFDDLIQILSFNTPAALVRYSNVP